MHRSGKFPVPEFKMMLLCCDRVKLESNGSDFTDSVIVFDVFCVRVLKHQNHFIMILKSCPIFFRPLKIGAVIPKQLVQY